MRVREFDSRDELNREMAELLRETFEQPGSGLHAVMLSGGSTPLPIYRMLAEHPPAPDSGMHLLFSDERMVPPDSSESNYGGAEPMIRNMGMPDTRIMRPPTDRTTEAAAREYDRQLRLFFERGGRIPLGLLGLGEDGHTASLFTRERAMQRTGRNAIAVSKDEGPDRVSVTRGLLERVGRIVFLVAGPEKRAIIDKLRRTPEETPAGCAVADHPNVELWFNITQ